jgi:hypothetical protein
MTPLTHQRVWAAVLTEYGPIAVITDEPNTQGARSRACDSMLNKAPDSDRRRVWAMSLFNPDSPHRTERDPNYGGGHGKGYAPGRPCGKCHDTARRVWERRDREAQGAQAPMFEEAP